MNLRVEVSNADILSAKRLWRAASAAGAAESVVEGFLSDYVQLISAQAQQIADDFRRSRASETGGA